MEQPTRPEPVRSVSDRARDWIGWFGLSRLIASAVATLIVCVGAFWLVRAPVPPSEASLPRVSGPASSEIVAAPTLPPPEPAITDRDRTVVSDSITVHVAGAVTAPGVYGVDAGARVHTAIDAAGGMTADAEADALNLAAVVVDGSRIYVPAIGEEVVAFPVTGEVAVTVPRGPVDVNRATAAELETLPGVGPATSLAIIAERERNGPFLGVDDLERVPGIGPAKLSSLRDLVTA